MISLIGTYECSLDTKGRIMIPSSLKKQLEGFMDRRFVLKRSIFQKSLELYPIYEWDKVMSKVSNLNRFVKKNNDFIRLFTAGLKSIEMDSSGRIQISKDLIKFANLEKNIVVSSAGSLVEIWDRSLYEKTVSVSDDDLAKLSEDVMGIFIDNNDGEGIS